MLENNNQVWFITGANKGLGAAIAKEALSKGYNVVAAARNIDEMEKVLGTATNLLSVKLDITNDDQVSSAVNEAINRFGRIDVLVNNAGYGLMGYFEEMSEQLIRQQIETNLFGTMKLTRAVLPIMRKQASGWIFVVSSTSGVKAVEGGSVYSASKFSLEGWTEGLSIELKPFGINCMVIEPGAFRTDFFNAQTSFAVSDIEIDAYQKQREAMYNNLLSRHEKQPGNPAKLAEVLMTAMNASKPPLRLLAGKYAVASIDQYLLERRSELDIWREVSASTDFD